MGREQAVQAQVELALHDPGEAVELAGARPEPRVQEASGLVAQGVGGRAERSAAVARCTPRIVAMRSMLRPSV